MPQHSLDSILTEIRALGEETRMRIVIVLARGELTVSELTEILQQSQPRVSRHVKILTDAGLLNRHREGAWVFYRLNLTADVIAGLEQTLLALGSSDEAVFKGDLARLEKVHAGRAETAATFFQQNADSWERLRKLHTPESDIEERMRQMVGPEPVDFFLDLGTGTGRMLIVFRDLYRQAMGYDTSREMLAVARTELNDAGVDGAHVRQADIYHLPADTPQADLICLHQVLHYLPDPASAFAIAAKRLKPGGRMLIVDFQSHDLEFLREEFAHRRLGFSDEEVFGWAKAAKLDLVKSEKLVPAADEETRLTVTLWLLADTTVRTHQTTKQKEVLNV